MKMIMLTMTTMPGACHVGLAVLWTNVLGAEWLSDDDLVDVVELVPVLVVLVVVAEQRLELGAARDGQVQRLVKG
jgi:hypothetical protein